MKKIIYILAASLTVLAACSREDTGLDANNGQGVLTLGVSLDGSKAAMTPQELLSNAKVSIYYADFSGLVAEYKYGEMPEKIYMPVGEYRVDVLTGEETAILPRRANRENKSYKGSATFKIENGKDCNVQVTAGVHCAVAQVNFDTSVPANFKSGYTLTIGTDDQNKLVYDAALNGSESFFIVHDLEAPELYWSFSGVRSKTGATVQKSGVIQSVCAGKKYNLNIKYTVKEGDADFDIYVDTDMVVIDNPIIFEPVSTGLIPSATYEIWAGHATVHADVDEEEYPDPSKIKVRYSSDGNTWKYADATRVSEGSYSALLTSLTAHTGYEYRLNIDGEDIGSPLKITTENAYAIPNGSFEEVSNTGKYYNFYDPSAANPADRTAWWGSGNGSEGISGSADMGYVICSPDESQKVDGNRSALLESRWAIVKFAAGNLFTGYFGGLVGTKGGKVYFGRPFTGRPTKLRFYAKYTTGKFNHIDDDCPYHVTTNDYDRARIFVALGNWSNKTYGGTKDCPVMFDTTVPSTLVDFNTCPETVAYAELVLIGESSDPHNVWKEYTLDLNYKKDNVTPQYIIISCASSIYGDYFSGYDKSKLWLDKMELIYE